MKTDLINIPEVGKKTVEILTELGYPDIQSLKNVDPQKIYEQDCNLRGFRTDRCQLYVYRCAVYFATEQNHDPEKLKWWNWKDKPHLD